MKYVWGCERGWDAIGGASKRTGATVGIASKMNTIDLLALVRTYRGCIQLLRSPFAWTTKFLPRLLRFILHYFQEEKSHGTKRTRTFDRRSLSGSVALGKERSIALPLFLRRGLFVGSA